MHVTSRPEGRGRIQEAMATRRHDAWRDRLPRSRISRHTHLSGRGEGWKFSSMQEVGGAGPEEDGYCCTALIVFGEATEIVRERRFRNLPNLPEKATRPFRLPLSLSSAVIGWRAALNLNPLRRRRKFYSSSIILFPSPTLASHPSTHPPTRATYPTLLTDIHSLLRHLIHPHRQTQWARTASPRVCLLLLLAHGQRHWRPGESDERWQQWRRDLSRRAMRRDTYFARMTCLLRPAATARYDAPGQLHRACKC